MNPITEQSQPPSQQQQQPPLPPPQLQPHRLSTSCNRHPQEQFTGFCPECLCERLNQLNPNTNPSAPSSSRKPPTSSTAAAALRAIFRPSASGAGKNSSATSSSSSKQPASSLLPELRRTKSFSASKNEALSGAFEPQRRSCDVRARNGTLWNLFSHETEKKTVNKEEFLEIEGTSQEPVLEFAEEEEEEERDNEEESREQNVVVEEEIEDEEGEGEIRVLEETNLNVIEDRVEEIVEEKEELDLKTMKDHIDLDSSSSQPKKDSKIAGSLWSAASVFSKKLQKWRQKQKMKKRQNGVVNGGGDGGGRGGRTALPVEKPIGRQYRDTQSEIADYGFGRRSCDTDPRFSLDAGRMSLDIGRMSLDNDPRYSFDEPRASWDGYLLGRTTLPRVMPTMLSVVEDAPTAIPPSAYPLRTDMQIPVEEPLNSVNGDDAIPGGTTQTREYYSDSSSRRRKSLDRSNSMRRSSVSSLVGEMDELKCGNSVSNSSVNGNSKVTPAGVDYVHGPKLAFLDRNLSSNSARDDCCSETFDIGLGDNASVIGNVDRKEPKKSRRWGKGWSIWGFIHRRGSGGGNKEDDDDRYSRANGVKRSYSESWQDLRGDRNGDPRGAFNGRVLRSNSSVSWRNSQGIGGGSFGTVKKNGVHGNGNGKKGKEEFVLERNKSARYSPNNIDNGLLRFYLTPMRGSRRNGSVKSKSNQAHSIARSVLRLY